MNDSPAAQSISERHEGWEADLPGDDQALWEWIAALDGVSRLALLAHCVSYGVNSLHEKPKQPDGAAAEQMQHLDIGDARFDQPAGQETAFMFHCHILEHEDLGRMGQFAVG